MTTDLKDSNGVSRGVSREGVSRRDFLRVTALVGGG